MGEHVIANRIHYVIVALPIGKISADIEEFPILNSPKRIGKIDSSRISMYTYHMAKNTNIFYISDTHLGSGGILRWNRENNVCEDFEDSDDYDETLITRWNEKITNRDHVYILGDMFATNRDKAIKILKRLNGAKHFIIGNHDRKWMKDIAESGKFNFLEACDYREISDKGRKVVLSHYPIMFWNGQHDGSYHIYGHLHGSVEESLMRKFGEEIVENGELPEFRAVNAGAMLHGFAPRTLDELIAEYDIGKCSLGDFRK